MMLLMLVDVVWSFWLRLVLRVISILAGICDHKYMIEDRLFLMRVLMMFVDHRRTSYMCPQLMDHLHIWNMWRHPLRVSNF